MNLTLKQLFKFGAVCACACALSATAATNYVADSFEVADGGSEGLAISQYKYTVEGGLDETTNYAWFAESGDASTIVSNETDYTADDGPIAVGESLLALNLETEGNTLSRTAGVDIADGIIYVDTLVKFTPSEDAPTVDMADVKIALFVNAESNLVIKSKIFNGGDPYVTNTVTSVDIDPEQWCRLTLDVKDISPPHNHHATRIRINGTEISDANGYKGVDDDGNLTVNGAWFLHGDFAESMIEKISFQGTGMLDEFVVTDIEPDFGGSTVFMLTLVDSGPGTVTFTAGGSPVTEVESGTEVVMNVDDWYQMGNISGSDASFETTTNITEDAIQEFTATFTADNSSTVTVATAALAGDWNLGDVVYDLTSVSAWALANGYVQGEVESNPGDYNDAYLMNVSTNVAGTAELVIASIDVAADVSTITVEATGDSDAVDFAALNGVVTVYTNAVLDGTFGLSDSYEITASVHDTATVNVTNDISELFIKAKVEVLP